MQAAVPHTLLLARLITAGVRVRSWAWEPVTKRYARVTYARLRTGVCFAIEVTYIAATRGIARGLLAERCARLRGAPIAAGVCEAGRCTACRVTAFIAGTNSTIGRAGLARTARIARVQRTEIIAGARLAAFRARRRFTGV